MKKNYYKHYLEIEVTSSGLEASRVHPTAIEVMSEVGIDVSNQTSAPLSDFNPSL